MKPTEGQQLEPREQCQRNLEWAVPIALRLVLSCVRPLRSALITERLQQCLAYPNGVVEPLHLGGEKP
jgi:hypothetical protein